MNCCDYNCHQGRDCPVRAEPVAKIGRKHHGREELPPSIWREQLRVLGKWMLIVWSLLFYAALATALLR